MAEEETTDYKAEHEGNPVVFGADGYFHPVTYVADVDDPEDNDEIDFDTCLVTDGDGSFRPKEDDDPPHNEVHAQATAGVEPGGGA